MTFLRFSELGKLEVQVVGETFVPIPTDDTLVLDALPVPVRVRAFATHVVASMCIDGVTLQASLRIDRRSRRVHESLVCLPLTLSEWALNFRDFVR